MFCFFLLKTCPIGSFSWRESLHIYNLDLDGHMYFAISFSGKAYGLGHALSNLSVLEVGSRGGEAQWDWLEVISELPGDEQRLFWVSAVLVNYVLLPLSILMEYSGRLSYK